MRGVAVVLALAACTSAPKPMGTVIVPDTNAADLLLDGSRLYWEDPIGGGILDLSIDPLDATPATLVSRDAALSAAAGSPTSIAIANGVLYWTNINQATRSGGSIWSVPISGGTPTVLVAGLDQPMGITVDGTSVYFIDDNVLYATSTQGGNYVQVASNVQEFHVANGYGYWSTATPPAAMFDLDLASPQATPMMIATSIHPDAFAVDANNLYLRSEDGLDVVVTEQTLAGGDPVTLFHDFIDDGAYIQRLVLDGSDLYWNARSEILRIRVDGSGLARPVQNDTDITSLVVASDAIYFATTRNDVPTSLGPCACPVIVTVPK